jgi:hypothetical protein
MKKMVLVLTLAVFALTGSAFAQDPAYQNNIGLYLTPDGHLDPTAEDGTGSCGAIGADVPFTAYLVLSKLTNAEVWGWEARVTPENMLEIGTTIYGDFVDAGTRPNEHIVGLAAPLFASGGAVAVAEFQYLVSGFYNDLGMPSYVFIEGVYFSLIDPIQGPPAYLEASGSEGVALNPAFGDPFNPQDLVPQLVMNGDCTVVSVEESSFGSVKSLFR